MQNPLKVPLERLEVAIKQSMPDITRKAGQMSVNFFVNNFSRQGWQDGIFYPWKERAKNDKKSTGRFILIQSGHLRAGIHVVYTDNEKVVIGNNMPYAQIHNEGGTIHHPGGKHTLSFRKKRNGRYVFTRAQGRYKVSKTVDIDHGFHYWDIPIPQRKFMGKSYDLTMQLEEMIIKTLLKQFK